MRLGGVELQAGLGQPAVLDIVRSVGLEVTTQGRITASEEAVFQAGQVQEQTVVHQRGVEVEQRVRLVPDRAERGDVTGDGHAESLLARRLYREHNRA